MKKSIINKNWLYLLGVLFILVIWGSISYFFDDNQIIFPSIYKVFNEFIVLLSKEYTYKCIFYSLYRLFIGFIISFVISLIIGTISAISRSFKFFIRPLITIMKSIPTVSLVFLFLVLVGAKNSPIFIVFLICFPIIYESVVSGYENIDKDIDKALKLENANMFLKIIDVRLPLAFPYIKVGVFSSLGLAFKIEIMAEVLTGTTFYGLGSSICYIQRNDPTNMQSIFAYSLIVIIFSLLFDLVCEKLINN